MRVPRLLSRTGRVLREPVAWSMAWPTAGGSGTRTTLVPLPHTCKTRWSCSSPRSAMSLLVASKTCKPSVATSAKSYGLGDWRAAASRASNCRWLRPRVGDFGGHGGTADVLSGRMLEDAVKHAGAVKPGREPPRHGGGLEPAYLLHSLDVQLQVRSPGGQRVQSALSAPGQVAAQIGFGVLAAGALEAGQVNVALCITAPNPSPGHNVIEDEAAELGVCDETGEASITVAIRLAASRSSARASARTVKKLGSTLRARSRARTVPIATDANPASCCWLSRFPSRAARRRLPNAAAASRCGLCSRFERFGTET